ncbi:MAG TPA: hypothetical protein VI030_15830 [Propionibacteriaceae bacterium]
MVASVTLADDLRSRLHDRSPIPGRMDTWLLLLFRHKLQVLIALYLYAVGYIIKPPGSLLECLGRLAGLEPLVMDWIGQTARDAVNGPVELV